VLPDHENKIKTKTKQISFLFFLHTHEKYQLLGLKRKCEDIIWSQLSFETAGEILALADVYSPGYLKPQVINFMTQ